jgi:squalene-associated FAD-dependent desaturase
MRKGKVHIVGAGLAGLAAAVALAERSPGNITIYDAARQAGGRCRSYFDSTLGMVIDNGNHLLLSGNHDARNFLKRVGSENALVGPAEAEFPFIDLATGESWCLRPNAGALPWWIAVPGRRVPGTKALDYLAPLGLFKADKNKSIGAAMTCSGLLYERLWRPFFLAALNTEPAEGSAALAAAVMRETLAKGGQACRPLVAAQGLSKAFIDPALAYLEARGAEIRLDCRLRALSFAAGRIDGLDFGEDVLKISDDDAIVLAVPAPVVTNLVPGLQAPESFRAIVNAHFKIAPPPGFPDILGVINGTVEWLFSFPDRLSVTISGADRLIDVPREELAAKIWAEVAQVTQIAQALPAWQIIKEKRATFAATVEEDARRPGPGTAYHNLALAGDWTATGLPATIEGAIRSGARAAEEVAGWS